MLAVFRGLMIVIVAALALVGCSESKGKVSSTTGIHITVSVGQCGSGWAKPTPGQQHFVLTDTDTRAGEVLLTDASTGAVYADVEPLGPGTSTDLDVYLGSGNYAFHCAMEDEATVVGPTVTVAGNVPEPIKPVQPVTQADVIQASKSYEAYVTAQLPTLLQLTMSLSNTIVAGDLTAARTAWLPAHLEYERLGAAYHAFGDLDTAINGLPNGLPAGVADPSWAGFHRIEYGLWHGESAASLRPHAQALVAAVKALSKEFAAAQVDPVDISIRAHEIAENALQFELTGQTDYGSHSNLATVRANLDGTAKLLGILRPLLNTRYAKLDVVDAALTRSESDLDALAPAHAWPALNALSTRQREHINADISNLCELLAPVAAILEPRRDS